MPSPPSSMLCVIPNLVWLHDISTKKFPLSSLIIFFIFYYCFINEAGLKATDFIFFISKISSLKSPQSSYSSLLTTTTTTAAMAPFLINYRQFDIESLSFLTYYTRDKIKMLLLAAVDDINHMWMHFYNSVAIMQSERAKMWTMKHLWDK